MIKLKLEFNLACHPDFSNATHVGTSEDRATPQGQYRREAQHIHLVAP
jgi:hypothetical protein